MIVLSVAHTKFAQGAVSHDKLTEYEVSKTASRAAFEQLYTDQIPCALLELGRFSQIDSVKPKQRMPMTASMAVEMHCNANANTKANYAEVIYHPYAREGAACAEHITAALRKGFGASNHSAWKVKDPRADGNLFFLRGAAPAVIVEGVFISNVEQANWLRTNGGAEAYGLLVAEGLREWWFKR